MGFRGLLVWQKAYSFVLLVYQITRRFPREELYVLVAQLQRAALSVPANIAEGYERKHRKEYVQFLHIARGSLGEIETYFSIARDLGYISQETYESVEQARSEVARLLQGLIRSLN